MEAGEVDFDARYTVESYGSGIAFWLKGWVKEPVDHFTGDPDFDYHMVDSDHMVEAVMVGDDRVHQIDIDELVMIDDDDYCHVCGQVGCTHDGRER